MRGRGTRKAKGKPLFTMFDFVGVSDFHGDDDGAIEGDSSPRRSPRSTQSRAVSSPSTSTITSIRRVAPGSLSMKTAASCSRKYPRHGPMSSARRLRLGYCRDPGSRPSRAGGCTPGEPDPGERRRLDGSVGREFRVPTVLVDGWCGPGHPSVRRREGARGDSHRTQRGGIRCDPSGADRRASPDEYRGDATLP